MKKNESPRFLFVTIGIICVLAGAAIIFLYTNPSNPEKVIDNQNASISRANNNNHDYILINRGKNCDELYQLDLSTRKDKKTVNPFDPRSNQLQGLSLPANAWSCNALISKNNKKAIVECDIYFSDASTLSNSPVESLKEFECDLINKSCEGSNRLHKAYQTIGVTDEKRIQNANKQSKINNKASSEKEYYRQLAALDNGVFWKEWDSDKDLLYGATHELWFGDQLPVYIYDAKKINMKSTANKILPNNV